MKINEITIGRKFNLGNFESMEIRISAEPTFENEENIWQYVCDDMALQLKQKIKEMAEALKL